MRVFVPGDAAVCAVGADAVAVAVGEGVVRNGSRGMFELEPLLEIETGAGRIGYARVDRAVTVTDGEESAIDVALQPAPTVLEDVVVTGKDAGISFEGETAPPGPIPEDVLERCR